MAHSEQESYEIGVEAFLYFYPLVTMDTTRRQAVNIEAGKVIGRGPMNTFTHVRRFPPADFRDVVRPNFDTLYSIAWLDLTKEPMVVAAPDTQGRYYLLPMLDMWTDVFACPGKRTTGTGAGRFAVVPPGWQGKTPARRTAHRCAHALRLDHRAHSDQRFKGLRGRYIRCRTATRWRPCRNSGKTPQPASVTDRPDGGHEDAPDDPSEYHGRRQVLRVRRGTSEGQPAAHHGSAHRRADAANRESSPASPLTWVRPMPRSSVGWSAPRPTPSRRMQAKIPTLARVVNGWQMNTDTMGVYGNYYLKRAIVALVGLGANLPEDASLSAEPGRRRWQAADRREQVRAALRQGRDSARERLLVDHVVRQGRFPVANDLNRNAIGDRDELKYNADGSLDIYFQNESPGKDKESNWLPAPARRLQPVHEAVRPQRRGARWPMGAFGDQESAIKYLQLIKSGLCIRPPGL